MSRLLALVGLLLALAVNAQAREIALTFDDAPRSDGRHYSGPERTEALIDSLAKGGVEGAIFFSTARHIDDAGHARMLRYQEAGHVIANHSYSHPFPHNVGLEAYVEDIRKADEILRRYDAFVPLYRFPFLNEGRDIGLRDGIRAALADMGYANGYVTVDNYDFYMDYLYQQALKAGRAVDMERLGNLYVSLLADAADFYDAIAQETLGRSPRHVMLLHENDLAALFVDELATELRKRGWTLIPGVQAYDDPIAEVLPDTLFNGQGRVAAIAETQGVPRRQLVHEAEDEEWLAAHFEAAGVFGEVAAWSPHDSDLLFSSNASGTPQIYLQEAGSSQWKQLTYSREGSNFPVWSPDGTRIAYQSSKAGSLDVWVMDADGGNQRQLTRHVDHDYLPSWTPDGQFITFLSWRTEANDFERANHYYIMAADGSGKRRLMERSPDTSGGIQWFADGQRAVHNRRSGETGADLFVSGADGYDALQLTNDGRFNGAPDIHPGGERLAFYSNGAGVSRIETIALDGTDRRVVIGDGVNWEPRWSADGCWLLYSVSVTADNSNLEVWATRPDRPEEAILVITGPGREGDASWRPDPDMPLRCSA